ncbi:metalloendopeptidase WSS1 [Aspergillus candidus]|uniref:WLM-domain-containing protein n=1 Tax=Aspergillus candidus TaxID=41067 RepID=A0A2I2FLL4_ASPCN|nr:WLM-domain-containing protein [Aspergillus candidus]PLB41500.1 WLM-domain-containing protein [Aspergillus candidus]
MREIDPLVLEYQHDKHRPRESEALMVLRKVASLVKPIMRRRDWKVGTLAEFYPNQRNLLGLNINGGLKICLRLRYPSDQRQFLPVQDVVDTMLHELCHIVIGPHNQQFHALWNQLRDEHEELAIKGYTGEGFLSQGKRLGGRHMPVDEARRQARAAAERRKTLSAGSGQRLGGAPVRRGTDIRRAIADAAQRRIEVTNGCASGAENSTELAEEASRNNFSTKAEEDDANERAIMQAYIDLIEEEERERYGPGYIPPSQAIPAGPRSVLSPPPQSVNPPAPSGPSQSEVPIDLTTDDRLYETPWTCPTCTLENPATYLCCDVCAAERPRPSNPRSMSGPATTKPSETEIRKTNKRPLSRSAAQEPFRNRTRAVESLASLERKSSKRPLGWLCDDCGSFMETEWWTCSNCGKMKRAS